LTVDLLITAIDHIQLTLRADQLDACRHFYGGLLGLAALEKPERLRANAGAWYRLGDVELHLAVEPEVNNEPSRRHVCYRVDDAEHARRALEQRGVPIVDDQQPIPELRRFYLRDPAGNRIEIAQRLF
jgi:catechol 2,3-dioxygenase-like lactoylglutathione lyase family enzyme